jgi:four helix bundle protein
MKKVEDLIIYKTSLDLIPKIYLLIRSNEKLKKDFSLCDQIKRAAISITTNISEGYFRGIKQTTNYYRIASGSANEVITLLEIIALVYKINTSDIKQKYSILVKQINSFIKSLSKPF